MANPDLRFEAEDLVTRDAETVWHPYSAIHAGLPVFPVASARGVRLKLADGRELIDGMASWWCVIHGYNHPALNAAVTAQLHDMAHVMFGGLTHAPAVRLAERLVELTPDGLELVFFADSGSVAVEVAMKMALQYWAGRGQPRRHRFVALRNGYHGDTLHAMSVCDPVTGMHTVFNDVLPQQLFVAAPKAAALDEPADPADVEALRDLLERHGEEIAALIVEPVVQGAGGMRFYSPDYLRHARRLCNDYDVLLIADEIATGFGRTGRLFACEHAAIAPDILCVGKALTGGYMTMAATLTTRAVGEVISAGEPGVFMHGPTFMANPLACAVSLASIDLLLTSGWQSNVERIEAGLREGLAGCASLTHVRDVRVLGAIGVVELTHPVDMPTVQPMFVDEGVWVRPFGRLVYLMPPFVIDGEELATLTRGVSDVVRRLRVRGDVCVGGDIDR
ncbi:MAG: adenosylmethionine--8-amino-7-oxononanoate transaminase [Gammaproteobacteria bacterium]|nr:adenosylmethionine--8-amino-7-oxononanoate transaminase [Gammaproteobacteria bacterium]